MSPQNSGRGRSTTELSRKRAAENGRMMRVRSRIDAQTYRRWLRKALGVLALLLIGQFFVSAGYLHASISSS